jgi:hypothetical protein
LYYLVILIVAIRDAAEMGDATTLNAITAEIKAQSDAYVPLN